MLGVIVLIIMVVGVAAALGGNHSPQPSSSNPGTYGVQVVQSGVACDGFGSTWTLGYGVGPNQQRTYGCGSQGPYPVTTTSSTDCVDAILYVQAGSLARSGLTTTLEIVQNGNILTHSTSNNDLSSLSVVYPNGC